VEFQGVAKSVAFYNLAMRLKRNHIPIDGVGLQCHFSLEKVDSAKLDATIRRFAEVDLKCIVTELDMGTPSTGEKDLTEQARLYRVVTDIVLNNENCPYMVVWGLKDNDSWRSGSNPLLYTAGLAKKPAWYAVRSALRHRTLSPATPVTLPAACKPAASAAVYTLDGRLVNAGNLRPGIYIQEGKKFIVKP
jgi:GH35 family endo-1,4-beta-xylanase